MEKFELLYIVLSSLHKAGVLSDCVLIGSLKEILDEFPRSWRKKVDEALRKSGLELPL